MATRIVVTRMGAVTPLGIGLESIWSGLLAGKSGVRKIHKFDTSELPVNIAAEVPGFHPEKYLSRKEINQTDPFTHFALVAADEALEGIQIHNPGNTGIAIGNALGEITTITEA